MTADPQTHAADPRLSVCVTANAGSGKTFTLVRRVARLLLAGADPAAILCVTFTKAAAAEMQRRLFDTLGRWAVLDDPKLLAELTGLGEPAADLARARALFARALDTPGGLKIQTIHAFCEGVLRRFPLEARLSPGFAILDDVAAQDLSRRARETVAEAAFSETDSLLGRAYAALAVKLDYRAFEGLFAGFEARAGALDRYFAAAEAHGGYRLDTWRRCGFDEPTRAELIEAQAVDRIRWRRWREVIEILERGGASDRTLAGRLAAVTAEGPFSAIRESFCTATGQARAQLGTRAIPQDVKDWLLEEQARCLEACERIKAAQVATDTVDVLTLGRAHLTIYETLKAQRGALDFSDIIARTLDLLTRHAHASWVLFKLDGGLDHILLDEAQDTAPDQWAIVEALAQEFFAGDGAGATARTLFTVGDDKQSIFSFQGARPERLAAQTEAFARLVASGGQRLARVPLTRSFRSAPDILAFADAVARQPDVLEGLRPAGDNVSAGGFIRHEAHRTDAGVVEIWPLEPREAEAETDAWAPLDSEPARSPVRVLAARIAREIKASVARGDLVGGHRPGDPPRAVGFGDFLILVRRRRALFHEIIRALKREGVEVAGADRFRLAEHGVRDDLMALGRIARFAADDLTLACLLRGPFCEVDELSLFELAHDREGSLWSALARRAEERADWASAAELVRRLMAEAHAPPFDFYQRFLVRLDPQGRSMRQRLITRMGAEGEEALLAFLAQTLEAEGRGVAELETFLAQMELIDLETKREAEAAGGRVRVMTVHGAKGLEAPVVILPDTSVRATDQGGSLFETDDGGFLWARAADDCAPTKTARERRAREVARESARLLYVALTRARDRLIIAGLDTTKSWFETSWRDQIDRAAQDLDLRPFALSDGTLGLRFRLDHERPPPLAGVAPSGPPTAATAAPAWLGEPAPAEAGRTRLVSPSRLGETRRERAPSPLLRIGGLGRLRRGELIHRLLQRLPDVPPPDRTRAGAVMLGRERDLDEAQRADILRQALGVLEDPGFGDLFGPGSAAEVALAGTLAGPAGPLPVSGRVDRLLIGADRILVADFKTNRAAPADLDGVEPAYLVQMAVYAAILRGIYPGREVHAALVWTDGPRLMALPDQALARALADLLAAPAPAAA